MMRFTRISVYKNPGIMKTPGMDNLGIVLIQPLPFLSMYQGILIPDHIP